MPTPSFLKYILTCIIESHVVLVFLSLDFRLLLRSLHCSQCFFCQFIRYLWFSGFFLSRALFTHWVFYPFLSLQLLSIWLPNQNSYSRCRSDYPSVHPSSYFKCSIAAPTLHVPNQPTLYSSLQGSRHWHRHYI